MIMTGNPDSWTLKVTLLGTGMPAPFLDRLGPGTLVETADGNIFLFDCGRGMSQRLFQLAIPSGRVNLFLTHFHSDHTVGIPDVWLTGWCGQEQRQSPMRIWGPEGTKDMVRYLEMAFAADINIRVADEGIPREAASFVATDIQEGVVLEIGDTKVTAFYVDHGDAIKPAFGYRIDCRGRSVVISGDTRYCENLVRFAQGADVIVHEVAATTEEAYGRSEALRHAIDHHITPEQAGKLFSRLNPRLAVYTHLVLALVTIDDLVERTRKSYLGPLEVGMDLMSIEVGTQIKVLRAAP
jgi:ribonuclease Z